MSTVSADKATPSSAVAKPVDSSSIGWALALFATLCFSIAPTVARGAIVAGFDSTSLLVARMILATLLLGGAIGLTAPSKLKMDRRGLITAILVGTINAAAMLLFFEALNFVEASLVAMIISISPLIVLSLLALRGEKVTYRHAVRLALALAGVYLLIGPGGQVNWTGIGFAALSVLLFSFQLVLTQWYLIGYDTRTIVFYITASMTVLIVGYWIAQGMAWSDPGLSGWLAVVALAVVSTFLSRLTYFAAVAMLGSGQLALLGPVETFFTIIWSILFLGERLMPLQFVGGAFILLSAMLAIKRLGRARSRPLWRLRPRP